MATCRRRSTVLTLQLVGSGAPTGTPMGLIRQYLPKGAGLSGYGQGQLDAMADEMNGRTRETPD